MVIAGIALLVVVGLVVAGAGLLGGETRWRSDATARGVTGSMVVIVVAAAGLAVVAVAAVGVVGLLGPGGTDEDVPARAPAPAGPAPSTTTGAPALEAPAATASGATLGPFLRLVGTDPDDDEYAAVPPAVDRLALGTVLQMRVDGFDEYDRGQARQCVTTTTRRSCGNELAVQFDALGSAAFQYLVVDDFTAAVRDEGCRAATSPCSVVVEVGDRRAEVTTVFEDALPPAGRVTVSPRADLVDGQPVTVAVEGFPPGRIVAAVLCAPPATGGTERCGAPGPAAEMTVGADGRARTTLVVTAGEVGSRRRPCGPGHSCAVAVGADGLTTRAPVVPVAFAPPPGASYDGVRLAVGLVLALGLLVVVAGLVVRSDWGPVGEEAAPEIDSAEYADLDALVAALPPEDADDASPRAGAG